MQSPVANQTHFLFVCGALDARTFEVTDFEGRDRLSSPYRFGVNLIAARDDIDADEVVGQRATLYILRDGRWHPYSGIVAEFRFLDRSTDFSRYSVELVAGLWLLSLNVQSRVFQKVSVPEIVEAVLKEAGMEDYAKIEVEGSYPQREYVVQYQESDLDFMSRLLEDAGIWFFFDEPPVSDDRLDRPGAERLVITDRPDRFAEIPSPSTVLYRARSGLHQRFEDEERESLHRLARDCRVVPKKVVRRNYNYRTPEVDLTASVAVRDGVGGSVYRFGGSFRDVDGAQQSAEIESALLATQRVRVHAAGDCRALRAGVRFEIEGHPRTDLSGWFMVNEVTLRGAHGALDERAGRATFGNELTLVPADRLDLFRPERRTPVPRVPGVLTAVIEANGSDYASIDETGRYKVRMPFDLSDTANAEASKFVRLAQPYSGANYGMHLPSHKGAEMVLGCIGGDPNRPVGLGTVPNANTVSPVTSANKECGVIRTAGGNEILLDDTDGKQRVRIVTAAKHCVELDDGGRRLALQSTDGNALVLDDKGEKASWNAAKHTISMVYKGGEEGIVVSTAGGHVIRIDDKNGSISIQSKEGHVLEMDDGGGTISMRDCKKKNTVTLDGSGKLVLDSKGEISINAAKDVTIKGSNINLSASKGKLEASAARDVTISGMKVSAKADSDLVMEGMNSTLKGMKKAGVEGTGGVEVTSSLQTKVSGLTTELSGQTMTTVKGGMVMIN